MIDYISINNLVWLQLRSHLISFGFKKIPEDIHFTIGFDERSSDINLHITKNSRDQNDKPHIKIVVIDKKLLEEAAPSLFNAVLGKMLQPLDVEALINDYGNNLAFIPFNKLENNDTSLFVKDNLVNNFNDISKIKRKTRLKIEGNLEDRLTNFVTSEEIQKIILSNVIKFSKDCIGNGEGGMVITTDEIINVIKLFDNWYIIKINMKIIDVIREILGSELTLHITWKIKRSLVAIKNAKKYSDTEHLNKPVRIVKN